MSEPGAQPVPPAPGAPGPIDAAATLRAMIDERGRAVAARAQRLGGVLLGVWSLVGIVGLMVALAGFASLHDMSGMGAVFFLLLAYGGLSVAGFALPHIVLCLLLRTQGARARAALEGGPDVAKAGPALSSLGRAGVRLAVAPPAITLLASAIALASGVSAVDLALGCAYGFPLCLVDLATVAALASCGLAANAWVRDDLPRRPAG